MPSRRLAAICIGAVLAAPLNASVFARAASADDYIRCESHSGKRKYCSVSTGKHGYVQLHRQYGRAPCVRGRSWDYNKYQIWVDDNCRAEFKVEERSGGNSAATAAAVIGALAIGAAIASAAHKDKEKDRYQGSEYLSPWMVGSFTGYNPRFRQSVDLDVTRDGRVTASSRGESVSGYINADRLYVGDYEFMLTKTGDGFRTTQVGDTSNQVVYRRR